MLGQTRPLCGRTLYIGRACTTLGVQRVEFEFEAKLGGFTGRPRSGPACATFRARFLAGLVKKKLGLKLDSEKVGDERIYCIAETGKFG